MHTCQATQMLICETYVSNHTHAYICILYVKPHACLCVKPRKCKYVKQHARVCVKPCTSLYVKPRTCFYVKLTCQTTQSLYVKPHRHAYMPSHTHAQCQPYDRCRHMVAATGCVLNMFCMGRPLAPAALWGGCFICLAWPALWLRPP